MIQTIPVSHASLPLGSSDFFIGRSPLCVCVQLGWGGAQSKFLFTHAKLAPSKREEQQLDKTALTQC